jgi:lipoprotein-anchoring transpeptidase ErfK/SrfK
MVELIASLLIDLSEQKLYAFNPQHQVVRTMPVSSGRSGSPTPVGENTVLSKFTSVTMRGRGYVTPGVPWVMCINTGATLCLHGAPWQERAGERFGVPRSHGCVRLPTHQARWLYEHTPLGTPVTIRP